MLSRVLFVYIDFKICMTLSAPQAKYFAHWLTRSLPSDNIGKLTASLQDAQVGLTPHQIDAALFAFKSHLSKGAILADEVGLGKTIEAGLEKELRDLDAEIKLRKSESKTTSRLVEKVRIQRLIKDLEKKRSEKRLNYIKHRTKWMLARKPCSQRSKLC